MRNKLLLLISFLCVVISASSQTITRQDADSMVKILNGGVKGIDQIRLVLNLAEFHMFKAGEFKADLDSATAFIMQAKQLNAVLKSGEINGHILLEESQLANEYHDRVKGKKLLEAAILLLDKEKNYHLQGKSYLALADYYEINNPTELAPRMIAFNHAITAFNKGGYIEREAFSYRMLAETDSSDVTTEVSLKKSLELYNSINYREVQGVYDLFAAVYIVRSDFPQALKWGLRALKTAEEVGDSTMMYCQINNHIGIIYHNVRDSLNAIKYYTAALNTAERYNDKFTVYILTHNVVVMYFNRQEAIPAWEMLQRIQKKFGPPDRQDGLTRYRFVNDLLRVHTLLNQFDLAETYYSELVNLEKENHFRNEDLSDIYVNILDYFFASRQYARMPAYLKKDEEVAKIYGNPRNKLKLQHLWFSYDTSQHNFQSALDHFIQYHRIYNTINSQARDRALKQLQIQFDTKKKEDQIAILFKQSQLGKANLKQAMLMKNMTIAGIIGALIIAALLYRQSRLRKRNNTVILNQNEQLQHFLTEKEWLLKEIHHRVKNNLQIVMSLLNSQSAYIDNEPALTAIHDSQHRVHAMSLIHQKLYNTDNVSSIDMSLYIRELTSYLGDSFNTGNRIRFEFEVEPLQMDVSQAVPLGLILNEAITNSIKYAFPGNNKGVIAVSLLNTGTGQYLLSIADNGVGMPAQSKDVKTGSLGMSLMAGLSEDLGGSFSIENKEGTLIKIAFVYELNVKRPATLSAAHA